MAREASVNISELNRISKPVLMCFICKLSFGNAKSFGIHANSEHSLNLLESEKTLLSREYSSAILQRNIDERPQISFLEPLGSAPVEATLAPDAKIAADIGGSTEPEKEFSSIDTTSPEVPSTMAPPDTQTDTQASPDAPPKPPEPPKSPSPHMPTPPTVEPKNYAPTMSPTSTVAPSFTIGACPDHINGRPLGIDCIR